MHITGRVIKETTKAIQFKVMDDPCEKTVWLPKSQIDLHWNGISSIEKISGVVLPEWLCKAKGLC